MTYYDLTDLSDAERDALLKKEASQLVVYTTADGKKIQAVRGDGKREKPLDRVVPHPDSRVGYMYYAWNDEYVVLSVKREQSGLDLKGEEYRGALTHLSREKGWRIDWDGFDEPVPVPDPAPGPFKTFTPVQKVDPSKRRRGRPKGSKNKPKPTDG